MEIFDSSTPAEQRYNAVQRITKAIPDISKKMLTQQLKELEYHDIVHREVYAQIPPKVEYSITEYGQLMKPVLQTMSDWGASTICNIWRSCTAKKTKRSKPIRTSENRFLGVIG